MHRTRILGALLLLGLLLGSLGAWAQDMMFDKAQRVNLELTIYNQNLAVVRDIRRVPLKAGENSVIWTDVPKFLDPTTVSLKSLTAPKAVTLRWHDFLFNTINSSKLLDKYVGQEVNLVRYDDKGGIAENVKGTLLGVDGGLAIKVNGTIRLNPPGTVVVSGALDGYYPKPTLSLNVGAPQQAMHELNLAYVTEGLSWTTEYGATLSEDNKTMDLQAWAVITNQSGVTFPNAKLRLISGEPRRMRRAQPRGEAAYMRQANALELGDAAKAAGAAAPAFAESASFEYHAYDLDQRATLVDEQTKQMALLESENVKIDRRFVFSGMGGKDRVAIVVKFKNTKENGLGTVLPAGRMRFHQVESPQRQQWLGEDMLANIGNLQEAEPTAGYAFELQGERRQTAYRRLSDRVWEEDIEITLKNGKKEDVTIDVIQAYGQNLELLKSSHPGTVKNSRTLEFKIPVPKEGEVKLTYSVRLSY